MNNNLLYSTISTGLMLTVLASASAKADPVWRLSNGISCTRTCKNANTVPFGAFHIESHTGKYAYLCAVMPNNNLSDWRYGNNFSVHPGFCAVSDGSGVGTRNPTYWCACQ